MTVLAKPARWSDVADIVDVHLSAKLRDALAPLGEEQVVHLQLPYGEKIISSGTFRWELLDEQADWADSYGASIPLALVASKSVELYDVVTHQARTEDDHGRDKYVDVRRSAPLFMTSAGQFFGLFENFAGYGGKSSLRGTAGGTTLIALPAIGTERNVKKFLEGVGMKLEDEVIAAKADHLQATFFSKMTYGPFIRDVLAHRRCAWRCDLIVFSPRFVARIREHTPARLAILEMTVSQLAVSHRRADRSLEVFQTVRSQNKKSGPTTAEVQALHLIADGSRPGFVPVVGSDADEDVLPASTIDEIVYGCEDPEDEEGARSLDPDRHFPLFFRPSLASEPCFYFLGRPFIEESGRRKDATQRRVKGLLKRLGNSRSGVFWHASHKELTAWLVDFAQDSGRPVKLPPDKSHFIKCGIIGFTPEPENAGEETQQ